MNRSWRRSDGGKRAGGKSTAEGLQTDCTGAAFVHRKHYLFAGFSHYKLEGHKYE